MRILGIDPGSRVTGYGVISQQRGKQTYIASGCIKLTHSSLEQRLRQIYDDINEIVETYAPQQVAIERVFVCHNVASALKLGHARGAAMVAVASKNLVVAEYSPRQIKQAVVGYGAAVKQQMQHMTKVLLNLSGLPKADAADALAVAMCHGHLLQKQWIEVKGDSK